MKLFHKDSVNKINVYDRQNPTDDDGLIPTVCSVELKKFNAITVFLVC